MENIDSHHGELSLYHSDFDEALQAIQRQQQTFIVRTMLHAFYLEPTKQSCKDKPELSLLPRIKQQLEQKGVWGKYLQLLQHLEQLTLQTGETNIKNKDLVSELQRRVDYKKPLVDNYFCLDTMVENAY